MKHKLHYKLLIASSILLAIGYGMYYYYAPPKEHKPYLITYNNDDTLRVAYIGDSWAYYHQPYDRRISDSLSSKLKQPVKITSQGFRGKSSKEIYWYLFDNPEMIKFISKGYDYCIIAAGINDANKKMSANYYKQSMVYIIQFLLANHITPIVIEMPDYDIEKVYRWQIPSRKLLRPFSRLITGTSIDCKEEYRHALDNLLNDKNYKSKVKIIRYKSWNSNYSEDLKNYYNSDGIHLNEKGYARLDSCIIDVCIQLKNKQGQSIHLP